MSPAEPIEIIALHGFLGAPNDFETLKKYFEPSKFTWNCPDYTKIKGLDPDTELNSWGLEFLDWYRVQNGGSFRSRKIKRYLLGYSQGGRLALQVFKHNLELFDGCILISANPGLNETEVAERIEVDTRWAERFLTDDLEKVMKDWNSQPVFAGSSNKLSLDLKSLDRKILAECIFSWSIANQENFSNMLSQSSCPVLYICGEYDKKYCAVGNSIKKASTKNFNLEVVSGAGHRAHIDQPEKVGNLIKNFIK